MMVAHIAGIPVEEWFAPLVLTGSSIAVAARLALRRLNRRPSESIDERSPR